MSFGLRCRFERMDMLIALRSGRVIKLERRRLDVRVGFGACDLRHGRCTHNRRERRAALVLALRDMLILHQTVREMALIGRCLTARRRP